MKYLIAILLFLALNLACLAAFGLGYMNGYSDGAASVKGPNNITDTGSRFESDQANSTPQDGLFPDLNPCSGSFVDGDACNAWRLRNGEPPLIDVKEGYDCMISVSGEETCRKI